MTAAWLKLCQWEGRKPVPNQHNAIVALDNSDYKTNLSYDEMLGMPMLRRSTPQTVTDNDVTETQDWMQVGGLKRIGRDAVRHAIALVSKRNSFHPVRDWLKTLQWDGVPRLANFAITYLGADDNPYNRAIGEMFVISMVARVMKPGCKADHMLILEGPQGMLKSTFCNILSCGYFSDDLPDNLSDKDTKLHLRGKWLIEIAEMHAFTKSEANRLKSFMTTTEDRYRAPYGVMEEAHRRQCVFIGTSNKDAYLRDDTGGRRFWPLKCGKIDVDAIELDRDQVFAEAVTLFHNGTPWWPDRNFEREYIHPQQELRFEQDAWTGPIDRWLDQAQTTETTLEAVAKSALGVDLDRLGMIEQKRIASILQILGWVKRHTRTGNKFIRPDRLV